MHLEGARYQEIGARVTIYYCSLYAWAAAAAAAAAASPGASASPYVSARFSLISPSSSRATSFSRKRCASASPSPSASEHGPEIDSVDRSELESGCVSVSLVCLSVSQPLG